MDDVFAHDLNAWLESAADRYVVTETLKRGPDEITEVVFRRDASGRPTVGPFVRKTFFDSTRGRAYEQILEAQTAGRRFAHLPFVYECEHTPTSFAVVMQYVQGETLDERVRRVGASDDMARLVMPALCEAVAELHEGFSPPLIHRDIKPSNVILTPDRVVLIDLGIARTYRDGAAHDTVRYGTPGFAPPEQFGYGQTSTLSDVYALGMTLAFCLTGEEPTAQLRERGFADPRISASLREVLVRATQFDPEQRYVSARAFKEALNQALLGGHRPPNGTRAGTPLATRVLGLLWNVLVALAWVAMLASLGQGIGDPIDALKETSVSYRVTMYLGMFLVPLTVIAYLLLDKRRIRPHTPLAGLTWRQELPIGLAVIFLSIVFSLIALSV